MRASSTLRGLAEFVSVVGRDGLEPKAAGVPRISLRCTDSAGPRYTATP
jgi:hypothetical protein